MRSLPPRLPHLLRFLIFPDHPPLHSYPVRFLSIADTVRCEEESSLVRLLPRKKGWLVLVSTSPETLPSACIVQWPCCAVAAVLQGKALEPSGSVTEHGSVSKDSEKSIPAVDRRIIFGLGQTSHLSSLPLGGFSAGHTFHGCSFAFTGGLTDFFFESSRILYLWAILLMKTLLEAEMFL